MSGLIKREYPNSSIDIFEKDLLPFGLIRYGVAPDHQDVKKITRNQTEIGKTMGIRYFGGCGIVRYSIINNIARLLVYRGIN